MRDQNTGPNGQEAQEKRESVRLPGGGRFRAALTSSAAGLLLLSVGVACTVEQETTTKLQAFVSGSAVFVSEIHYDSAGSDSGEAIEVSGPAGTDLTGYSLVLYNGTGGAVYRTVPLTGTIDDEGDGQGAVHVALAANGLQNGSPDGIALVDAGGEVLEFLSYEGTFTAVGGPANGLLSTDIGIAELGDSPIGTSLQLIGSGPASERTWRLASPASFGLLNGGGGGSEGSGGSEGPELGNCGEPATAIAAVQGSGAASPLVGREVVIEGVVIADFQGSSQLGGFFVQSTSPDSDPASSDGVFVHDLGAADAGEVALGDVVRVLGEVKEYFGLTEIEASALAPCGTTAVPAPTPVRLPTAGDHELEAVEGMLVRFEDLTVTETFSLGRYGEVSLSSGGRLFHPNGSSDSAEANLRRRILLDDGRNGANRQPVYFLGADRTLRIGDTIQTLTGAMHYAFGTYRVQPIAPESITFERTNPRSAAPKDVGGDVRVASLNVLNYFVTLGSRGAGTSAEFARQRAKIVSAIVAIDADVLGLIEIENRGTVAIDDLVLAVNAALGSAVYARAPEPDFTGTDAIRAAILYQPSRVTATGLSRSDADPIHDRPPLAQGFSYLGDDFSVIVNHFKSKGSCPPSATDPDADHGQGCFNALRVQQAVALSSFIEEVQAEAGDDDVVVLGDLNSYESEDPILHLEAGGLLNLNERLPAEERYSYVFSGESGTLDYAMTTPSVAVATVDIWHINSDEPPALDYQVSNGVELYAPDAFRSSDHDPVIVGLLLADPVRSLEALAARTASLERLTSRQRASLLRLVQHALEQARRAERSSSRPLEARLARAHAYGKLALYEFEVRRLVRRGKLPREVAASLIEAADEVQSLLR